MRPRTPAKKTAKPKARKKPAKTRTGTTYRRKGIDDQQMDPKPDPWPTPPPR